ncbi:MAG TPA: 6-phosphogluconolactonase [Chlamydiales bacterium]|nr:6-phosphogluconolactonase [Chlamydiales bacterium]
MLNETIQTWDDRRYIAILNSKEEAIRFAALHWQHSAERSIQQRGRFAVALSGGSTPKAMYELLSKKLNFDWNKVFLFWSDERGVPPTHLDSNYRMAMESGFQYLSIPQKQIFRMQAETNQQMHASAYEKIIYNILDKNLFDLVMLGIGEDGHIASLFPHSPALDIDNRLIAAQFIPGKDWRMTFTFPCINQSRLSVIYAIGLSKASIVKNVLNAAVVSPFPASRIGTHEHPALWILDNEAASEIK